MLGSLHPGDDELGPESDGSGDMKRSMSREPGLLNIEDWGDSGVEISL